MVQMGLFRDAGNLPAHYIPQRWQYLMGLNPMAGVVIGFRHALLGTPASWQLIGVSPGGQFVSVCFRLADFPPNGKSVCRRYLDKNRALEE